MDFGGTILDLALARSAGEAGEVPARFDLRLSPGDLLLIDAPDAAAAAQFADLCCGLIPLAEGTVRFLGRDWATLPRDFAAALRGRIGRVFATGGWIDSLDVATNILLPQLHHTRHDPAALRDKAASLACAFGLPGLPLGRAADLPPRDLARVACVRAFLGDPALLLLESPVARQFADFMTPLLNAVAAVRSRGAAAIWFTGSDAVWRDRAFPATQRWRLGEAGLQSTGHVA
jgi:phospholipid/cholesterol/gamma-HCH transport system ATP-binding protein